MARKVIITCAVTGGDDTAGKFVSIPVTPAQIATAAIEAEKAGAAIAHIHVRNPDTGKPSIELELYREVVQRIRDSGSPVIINLTTGAGARFLPSDVEPNTVAAGSNLRTPSERSRHILALKPELCSLDLGSLNFGSGALINVQRHIEAIAAVIREAGVMPELEIFDTGHMALALDLIKRGIVPSKVLFQFVLGVPWGAPATTEVMSTFKSMLPAGTPWCSFGIGRHEFPIVAQSMLMGGHVRVGLEDNLYLSRGVVAPDNASLVSKARQIIELMGEDVATPAEAREILGLAPR